MYYRVHSTKVKVKCWYRTKAEAIAAFDRQAKRAGAPPLDYPPTISGDSITTSDIAYPAWYPCCGHAQRSRVCVR